MCQICVDVLKGRIDPQKALRKLGDLVDQQGQDHPDTEAHYRTMDRLARPVADQMAPKSLVRRMPEQSL